MIQNNSRAQEWDNLRGEPFAFIILYCVYLSCAGYHFIMEPRRTKWLKLSSTFKATFYKRTEASFTSIDTFNVHRHNCSLLLINDLLVFLRWTCFEFTTPPTLAPLLKIKQCNHRPTWTMNRRAVVPDVAMIFAVFGISWMRAGKMASAKWSNSLESCCAMYLIQKNHHQSNN